MKRLFTVLVSVFLLSAYAQEEVKTDEEGFETFTYRQGDSSYTMKKYFVVFLKRGEKRSQPKEEAAEIQKQHLAHISWMAEERFLDMAGPFGDKGEIRGILIMRVPTEEKARELVSMDPAVKAGRLEVELHPWWAAEGSCLK